MSEIKIYDDDAFIQYQAVGAEAGFDYDFPIFDSSHLVVELTGTDGSTAPLVEGTDYTVSGVGVETGGSITLTTAAVATQIYTLYRDVPEARTTDFTIAGNFKAETVNREFDLIIQMLQQNERNITRSLRLSIYDTGSTAGMTLPSKSDRAGKFLAFDANGDASAASGTGTDNSLRTDLAASSGAALIGAILAASTAVAQSLDSKLFERISVFDFMTTTQKADVRARTAGEDVTTPIQNALEYCSTNKRKLYFPAGVYKITSQLDISSSPFVLWEGEGQNDAAHTYDTTTIYCNGVTGYTFSDYYGLTNMFVMRGINFDGSNGDPDTYASHSSTWSGILKCSTSVSTGIYVEHVNAYGSQDTTSMWDLSLAYNYNFLSCRFDRWSEGRIFTLGGTSGVPTSTIRSCTMRYAREIFNVPGNCVDVAFYDCMFEGSVVIGAIGISTPTVRIVGGHAEAIGYDWSGNGYTTGLSDRDLAAVDSPAISGSVSAAFTVRYASLSIENFSFGGKTLTTGSWIDGIGRGTGNGSWGSVWCKNCRLTYNDSVTFFAPDSDSPSSRSNFGYFWEGPGNPLTTSVTGYLLYADARLLTHGKNVAIKMSDSNFRFIDVQDGVFNMGNNPGGSGYTAPPTVYPNGGQWNIGDKVALAAASVAAGKELGWLCSTAGTSAAGWETADFIPQHYQATISAAATQSILGTLSGTNGEHHVWEVVTMQSSITVYTGLVYVSKYVAGRSVKMVDGYGTAGDVTAAFNVNANAYTVDLTNNNAAAVVMHVRLIRVFRT